MVPECEIAIVCKRCLSSNISDMIVKQVLAPLFNFVEISDLLEFFIIVRKVLWRACIKGVLDVGSLLIPLFSLPAAFACR
jgi:hypothetical protein